MKGYVTQFKDEFVEGAQQVKGSMSGRFQYRKYRNVEENLLL